MYYKCTPNVPLNACSDSEVKDTYYFDFKQNQSEYHFYQPMKKYLQQYDHIIDQSLIGR